MNNGTMRLRETLNQLKHQTRDKQAILSFTRELLLNNITKARATKYLYHLTANVIGFS